MSTSYQDIDVRLVGVENALKFLMESMRVRVAAPVLGSDGTPVIRDMSMFDFYREQLAGGLLIPEASSGTDSASE